MTRVILFLAAGSSGAALLLHVYGVAPMWISTPVLVLPATLLLIIAWAFWRRRDEKGLATALSIGALGGLLGTFGYDVVRIPFMLSGQRIFVPIRIYGLWITDASASSPFTDAVGWSYHFLNGITFGVMYSLFMARRHVVWAIVWAFALETIAVFSPFGRIFGFAGNWAAIGIAYLGHLAYGLPLGLCVARWDATRQWQATYSRFLHVSSGVVAVVTAGLLAVLWQRHRDARFSGFNVTTQQLQPDIARVPQHARIVLRNAAQQDVVVRILPADDTLTLRRAEEVTLAPQTKRIHRLYVLGPLFSRSSFLLVEPVHEMNAVR